MYVRVSAVQSKAMLTPCTKSTSSESPRPLPVYPCAMSTFANKAARKFSSESGPFPINCPSTVNTATSAFPSTPSTPSTPAPTTLLHQSSHPLPLRPILIILAPDIPPIPHVLRHALRSPDIHPSPQETEATPESYPPRQPEPEEERADKHVEDFEGDENDDEEESDGGEVGFLLEEGEEVGFGGGE